MEKKQERRIPPSCLWKYQIDPIDLFILAKLHEGVAESALNDHIEEEFGVEISRNKVSDKIRKLEDLGVILKRHAVIINPTKLYDHVYLAFIKTKLSSLLAPAGASTWKDAFEKIKALNEESGFPLKIFFNVGGMGEYDFVALVYTNDPQEYHKFKAKLVQQTGIIEKFDTKYVDTPELFFFRPIEIPDFKEYDDIWHFWKSLSAPALSRKGKE